MAQATSQNRNYELINCVERLVHSYDPSISFTATRCNEQLSQSHCSRSSSCHYKCSLHNLDDYLCIDTILHKVLYQKDMGLGRLFVSTQTYIDGADYLRGLYTSYGKTTILDLGVFVIITGKIGSIGFAATTLSSNQVFMLSHHSIC